VTGRTQIERLGQIAAAASTLTDIVRREQTLRFHTPDPTITVYVHTELAEVRVLRHDQPQVEIAIMLQAPFAWRLAAEQDDAGVYVVARRRPLVKSAVGGFAGALIEVLAPAQAHLIIRLDRGRLIVENADGTFDLPGDPRRALVVQP
jgi:hypothetical protein